MCKKLVIADDEAITRMDIKERLEGHGYVVVGEAADGFDAIEICREKNPDLILMDIKMPMLDGLSAAKTIFEEGSAGCIVMLTAYSDKHFILAAKDMGIMGYVVKPIDEKSLIPTLEVALARSADMAELKKTIAVKDDKIEERKIVEKAKGLLMKKENMDENKAYEYIRDLSMKKRNTMKNVAQLIIISYENMGEK